MNGGNHFCALHSKAKDHLTLCTEDVRYVLQSLLMNNEGQQKKIVYLFVCFLLALSLLFLLQADSIFLSL